MQSITQRSRKSPLLPLVGILLLAPVAVAGPDSQLAQCAVDSPQRSVGEGLDAPGTLDVPTPPVGRAPGPCAQNRQFRMGAGLSDVTGSISDTNGPGWVNPQQVFSALHTRVHARAFALESACNGRRILYVSVDTGLMNPAIRAGVLAEIAADPALQDRYHAHNVMIGATHTHADPNTNGDNGLPVLVAGIVDAIRRADANLQAHGPGRMTLSTGELLNTNINRSKPAYANNPAAERGRFVNERGEEVQVNKLMVQLELNRGLSQGGARAAEPSRAAEKDASTPIGLINWFGVHPTIVGPDQPYVSGDMKTIASLRMEEIMGTDYRAPLGEDTYVAAFAQADEGDSSPNIFIEERPYPDPRRGGGENDLDSSEISATKHLARALELLDTGAPVTGPVDFRFAMVQMDQITVEDPVVLAGLDHPPELDDEVKRTCSPIMGASFGAGAEDGPGPAVEGLRCDQSPEGALAAALADVEVLMNARLEGFPGSWPARTIPAHLLSVAAMCNVKLLPPSLGDYSCQAEKPVLLPLGPSLVPFQIVRIGQLAILGLPWEVGTVPARRLRATLLEELAPIGVERMVVASLVNDDVRYLTTREEYATQQYEGASTLYGPWTLAAVQQEALKLARAMRGGEPLADRPDAPDRIDLSLNGGPVAPPHPAGSPGTPIAQPAASIRAGDTVRFEFVAGHPRNDLRLQESYAYVERQGSDGTWAVLVEDRDPDLIYDWKPHAALPAASPVGAQPDSPFGTGGSAEVIWHSPRNLPDGTYRLRAVGAAKIMSDTANSYEAISEPFQLEGTGEPCP